MAQTLILVTSAIRSQPDNMTLLRLEDVFAGELHFLQIGYFEDEALIDKLVAVSTTASIEGVETLAKFGQVFTGEEAMAYLKSLPSTEFEQLDFHP